MTQAAAKIRLYITGELGPGRDVTVSQGQAHYLSSVMRRATGDLVLLFNGQDGEWLTEITSASKREVTLTCQKQTRPQTLPPDLWLCFAPIKKARTDFIAEKACEMGSRRLVPVFTQNTNAERVRTDRLAAHGIEAAEQCGLLSVPEVVEPVGLKALLSDWPAGRQLLFCDETGQAPDAAKVLRGAEAGPWAVLIGPEGGFTEAEASHLRGLPFAHPASLGPRILRADTAAVAALAVWQTVFGDWRGGAA